MRASGDMVWPYLIWVDKFFFYPQKKHRKVLFFCLKLVGDEGFEPPTHWSQTSCATGLR